jgi:hypothetical protein
MIADCVNYYARHEPERVQAIGSQVERYYRLARRLRVGSWLLSERPSRAMYWLTVGRMSVVSILGLPIALYGCINNFVPYRLARLAGLRNPSYRDRGDKTKISIYSLLVGTVAFLAFYAAQGWLVWFSVGGPGAIAYLLSLPPSGLLALAYAERLGTYRRDLLYARLQMKRRGLIPLLKRRRDEVLATLDAVRVNYVQEILGRPAPQGDLLEPSEVGRIGTHPGSEPHRGRAS